MFVEGFWVRNARGAERVTESLSPDQNAGVYALRGAGGTGFQSTLVRAALGLLDFYEAQDYPLTVTK